MTHTVELTFGLMIAVAALAVAARKICIPYPILFVIGGLLLGLIPGLPPIHPNPDLVLLIFLPPLLYPAALFTSWRDFSSNLRPISLLAVRLVLITTAAVALVTHKLLGLPWAAAFVLGAIVSPPDAVAVVAITQSLPIPRRLATIIEGESLVNDATAFVIYKFAVAAVVTGTFSLALAGVEFLYAVAAGVLAGIVVGWLAACVQRRLDDPPVQTTLSLMTPFAAYLAASCIGASGVLAVVIAGLYLGRRSPEIINSRTRFLLYPVWEMVVFILNGVIFILVGLQLPRILANLSGHSLWTLCWQASVINLALILVRIIWIFRSEHFPFLRHKRSVPNTPASNWRQTAIVAWAGIRGVDSMAAAMALPLATDSNIPFPGRDLILFHTFAVILVTLVLQGLSLPLLIRWLAVADDGTTEREELRARLAVVQAALAHLNQFQGKSDDRILLRLRTEYENRMRDLEFKTATGKQATDTPNLPTYEQMLSQALLAERSMVLQLRNKKIISDDVLRRIQRDLDLAELKLNQS